MNRKIMRVGTVAAICSISGGPVLADDWSVSGFIRQEIAAKTSADYNTNNQQGNSFNGTTNPNPGPFRRPSVTVTRPASATNHNDFNQFSPRIEVNLDGKLSESWSAHFKLRGIADQIGHVGHAFQGVNNYQQEFYSRKNGTPLESAGKDWMLDLPVAYLDYSSGPLWIRVGNQQIAWGEAIFFRVSDVVNGLDLRRHSVLGVAAEEYSDSRVPALGIRSSYRLNDDWDVEGFVQKFQPSILPSPNSPFNPIPAQFTIHEKEGYDAVNKKWNLGFRTRGKIGEFGVQAFAVRRDNPDGVYRWTLANGAGALPGSAFEANPTGVYSAAEWFRYASSTRLNGLGGLETALNEFPGTTLLGANVVAGACGAPGAAVGGIVVNQASASCTLDTFFTGSSLRGHLIREFPRESVFGFGVNRVFEGAPDSLLDQLIGRFEASYTPNKKFTNPTLSRNYIEKNESTYAFIFEKYHKFSAEVPATYVVAQWMHK